MSENEKSSEKTTKEKVPTKEELKKDEILEKKVTSEEELKEIFGEDEGTEEKEPDPLEGKTELEQTFLKETGLMPEDWVSDQVSNVIKTDHKTIANWNEINEWIKGIARAINESTVIVEKIREFCPSLCANPQMIKRQQFYFPDKTNQFIAFIPQACLTCPLFAYGKADAMQDAPDEEIHRYVVGEVIGEESQEPEETPEEE